MINYYEELKLDNSLKCQELSKELMQLQRKWIGRTNAPDLNRRQEAEKKVAIIEEAQGILVYEDKRREYDLELKKFQPRERGRQESEVDLDPSNENINPISLINEAWGLINREKYADAIVMGKKAIDIDPNNSQAWSVLGHAYRFWGNFEEAIYAFEQAIDKKANEASYYTGLGNVYLDLNQINQADEYAKKASQIDADNINNRILIGNIAIEKKQYNRVINIFTELLKIESHNESFKRVIADAYYAKGLEFCARNRNNMLYCIDGESTKNMIKHMEKAKEYYNNVEYDEKISWGKEALKKRFYKPRWKWFIVPLFFSWPSNFLTLGLMTYFNRIPQWRLTRSALLNEEITITTQLSDGIKSGFSFIKDSFKLIKAKVETLNLNRNY